MKFIKNIYHYFLAWAGNIIYRSPSKELFVLGITGTKGKSTVVELSSAILESSGKKTALLSSVHRKIGTEVLKNKTNNTMPGRFFIQKFLREAVTAGCNYAILEVTSQGIVQHRHRFIDFNAALFLNLHPEHIEGHGSYENYRAAKVSFFTYVAENSQKKRRQFFINREDKEREYFFNTAQGAGEVHYFSRERFLEAKLNNKRTALGNWFSYDFNLEDAAAANSFAEAQGISWATIKNTFESFGGLSGRMEKIQEKPFSVIVDYAHTPVSLGEVYQALHKQKNKTAKLICVFGSDGGGRDKWKRPEMGKIAEQYCGEIILTTENPYDEDPKEIIKDIRSGMLNEKTSVRELVDRREAINQALILAKKGDIVITTGKGSESYIHSRGEDLPWDEKSVIEELLNKRIQ